MIEASLQALINDLTLIVKKNLTGIALGQRNSKKLGAGFIFDQLRDYQPGDDVRAIDWSGYARTEKLFIRSYQEERLYPITIVVDASYSHAYGSGLRSKYEEMVRIAGLIALLAEKSQQPYELLVIGTQAKRTALKRGQTHLRALLSLLCESAPSRTHAARYDSLWQTIRTLVTQQRVVYVLSDCFEQFSKFDLAAIHVKHALQVIRVLDPLEKEAPLCNVPLLEHNKYQYAVLQDNTVRGYCNEQNRLLRSIGIPHCTILANTQWIHSIRDFLQQKVLYEPFITS